VDYPLVSPAAQWGDYLGIKRMRLFAIYCGPQSRKLNENTKRAMASAYCKILPAVVFFCMKNNIVVEHRHNICFEIQKKIYLCPTNHNSGGKYQFEKVNT
jgi:hypothetical protein